VKVDVDQVQPVAAKYSVSAMPTFLYIKNKEVIHTVKGPDARGLEEGIKKYAPPPASSGSGSPAAGDISLLEFLDITQSNCLNEASDHSIKEIIRSKARNASDAYLISDADEQLLINLTFNQTVRVRSIVLRTTNSSQGPKLIKLLTNRPAVGFEDVESQDEPAVDQVIEISEDTVKEGKHIPLRFVRFQTVNTLHIFVSSNHGGEDETRIDAIDVFGVPVEITKDLSGLKRQEE